MVKKTEEILIKGCAGLGNTGAIKSSVCNLQLRCSSCSHVFIWFLGYFYKLTLLPAVPLFPEGLIDSHFSSGSTHSLQASYVTQQPNFSLFVQANGMSAVWYLTALNWAIVLVSACKLLVSIGNIQRLVPKCQQLPGSHYLQKHSTSLCQSLIIKLLTAITNLLLMNFSTFMCFHFCLYQLILSTKTG